MYNFPEWMGNVPRNCATWSALEDQELLEAFRKGYSINFLAKKHGRSTISIVTRLERLSLQFKSFVRNNISSNTWYDVNSGIRDMDMSDVYKYYDCNGNLIPEILAMSMPEPESDILPPPKKKDTCSDNCSPYKYCMVLLGILLVSVLIVSNLTL